MHPDNDLPTKTLGSVLRESACLGFSNHRQGRSRAFSVSCGGDMEKKCSKCGQVKPLADYYRDAAAKDGLCLRCKICHRAVASAYYLLHRDKKAAYSLAHHNEKGEYDAAYRVSHRQARNASARAYYQAHREEEAVNTRIWALAHPDKMLDYEAHRRALKRQAYVEVISRTAVYARDGGRCHICHKRVDPKKWHLDHLIPLSKGGEHSYRNVAVACPKCNISRGNRGHAQMLLLG
jgi:hypothetical protein